MSPPRSKVWKNFIKVDNETASCKICFKHLKTSGNTSNLAKHMKQHAHIDKFNNKAPNAVSSAPTEKQQSLIPLASPYGTTSTSFTSASTCTITSASTCSIDNIAELETSEISQVANNDLDLDHNVDNMVNNNDVTQVTTPQSSRKNTNLFRYKAGVTPSIEAAFRRVTSYKGGSKYAAITQCILYFICKDRMPFNAVTGVGFKRLLHELAPSYKIPHPDTFKAKLDQKYEATRIIFSDKISKSPHICFTFDIWTESMQTKSFLGVTAHFLNGVNLSSACIATMELSERHTGQYIGEQLEEILANWQIAKNKIVGVVTDNGSNVVSAVSKTFGKNKHIPCFAHTINLIADSIIKDPTMVPLLEKVRDIVKWAKKSVIVSDKFRKMQMDLGVAEGNVRKLILDVPTRWNSTYYLLERFLEMAHIVNQLVISDINAPIMLSAAELDLAKQIKMLLKPLEFVTKETSGESYVTVSKIIPIVNCLKRQIENISPTSDVETVNALKKKCLSEIVKRFGQIELCFPLSIASLLDPRFKKIHFQDALACSKSIDYLRRLISSEEGATTNTEDSIMDMLPSTSKGESEYDFWKHHKVLAHTDTEKRKHNDPASKINDELSVYLSNPVTYFKTYPLRYWEEVKSVFPTLYKQAMKHFCIVATSVPSERLFSSAGATITHDRNRLSSSRLEKLLFLADCDEEDWFA